MTEQQGEPLKVYLVNPPPPDPWKTQGDYWNEQKRARRLYVVAFTSIIVSAVGAVGASVGAMAAIRGQAAVAPQVVRVECAPPASATK